MIDLGGIYPAAIDVYDDTGALANATTVTLTITLPDGTTTSPAVTNPPTVTGQYRYAYLTTQAGRHTARWVLTSPDGAYTEAFDVTEAATTAIVSLTDAKRRLKISATDTTWDDELRDWIAGLTATIEDKKGQVIARRTISEETDGRGRTFRLWRTPVISLTTVALADGTVTYDPADMDVPANGLVRVLTGPAVCGRLAVTYTAGCQIVPANYVEAALVILQNLWAGEERGAMGVKLGDEEEQPPRTWKGEYWGLVPRRAQELLGLMDPVVA
jgi:hypothetical protein